MNLRVGGSKHRCDCCQHLIYDCDCVIVRFNKLNHTRLSIDSTKYRVCYKCASIVEWHWKDRRDRFQPFVTNEEQRLLLGGLK